MSDRNPQLGASRKTAPGATRVIPWWVSALVILGALLNTAGAILSVVNPAMIVSPHAEINEAVHVYAGYVFSRDMAVAILLTVLLFAGARRALSNLMLLVALIQFLDTVVDCAEGRWPVAAGVLVFGILYLVGAARLSGHPFWRPEAWMH
jgi:hypothetical protein